MKKGFTLVELMAVIVILCIILLMSVPAISNTLKKQEDQEYTRFVESLCLGTKAYMRHHADEYESFFDKNVTKKDVCAKNVYNEGYVSQELLNPSTSDKTAAKNEINSAKIEVGYSGDKIVCKYYKNGC